MAEMGVETMVVEPDARSRRAVLRFQKATATAAGISSTLRPRESVLIPGSSTTFVLAVSNHGTTKVSLDFPTLTVQDRIGHVSYLTPSGKRFQAEIEPGTT